MKHFPPPLRCSQKARMPGAWSRHCCADGENRALGGWATCLGTWDPSPVCCEVNAWANTRCSAWALHEIKTWESCSHAHEQVLSSSRGAGHGVGEGVLLKEGWWEVGDPMPTLPTPTETRRLLSFNQQCFPECSERMNWYWPRPEDYFSCSTYQLQHQSRACYPEELSD